MLRRLLKREKDWYFYFYTVFVSIVIFIFANFAYKDFTVSLVMAFMNFFFLRIMKFIYDVAAKLIGVWYEEKH